MQSDYFVIGIWLHQTYLMGLVVVEPCSASQPAGPRHFVKFNSVCSLPFRQFESSVCVCNITQRSIILGHHTVGEMHSAYDHRTGGCQCREGLPIQQFTHGTCRVWYRRNCEATSGNPVYSPISQFSSTVIDLRFQLLLV